MSSFIRLDLECFKRMGPWNDSAILVVIPVIPENRESWATAETVEKAARTTNMGANPINTA